MQYAFMQDTMIRRMVAGLREGMAIGVVLQGQS